MKPIINLNDLMQEKLYNMYEGEKRLKKSLPKILLKVTDVRLRSIINIFIEEQENQIWRLKQIFEELFLQKTGGKSEAIKAMLNEAHELISNSMDPEVMDAGVITALQPIIHYQIAAYGAICNYANTLDLFRVAEKNHLNLEEKKSMDKKLVILAEEWVNLKAKEINL